MVGVDGENLLEEGLGAVVVAEAVPLAGFLVEFFGLLELVHGRGLLGGRNGEQGLGFELLQLLVEVLGTGVGGGGLEGVIDQRAGFGQALVLLDEGAGAQVLGFGEPPRNLGAVGFVLRTFGELGEGGGEGGIGRGDVAGAQLAEAFL